MTNAINLITALPALLLAIAALWRTFTGKADHVANAQRIDTLEQQVNGSDRNK